MRPSVCPAWPAVVCFLLLGCTGPIAAATNKQLAPGICPSKDIRSQPESLKKLEGCRVIEGHLSIVVMERATHKSYENISFPELREVTGYIKIYRMNGITNFGDLFPNLSVIRGMQLFKDFALVIFDNGNLESIGLRSLTKIERGAVRIQNNDRLCYTNTIDWGKISPDPRDNLIRSNYDERLCGFCPHAQSRNEDRKQSEQHCPADSTGRLLCWDDRHCQAVCPSACGDRACMRNGTCCHASCLGGCDGPTPRDCHVCRNYSFGYNNEWTCMERCPAGTYALNHRCVTEQECRSTPAPLPDNASDAGRVPAATIPAYKIFNDKCIYSCPSGYVEVGDVKNATCGPCPATGCVRECAGGKIDSVASAELYRGCTYVTGTLEIALRASGGNTMSVLETSLGEIRVIEGGLKVTRSYPLVSLMFLKNLRKIVGSSTENKGQSFHIFSNPNLELLWNWTTHGPIEITHGKLFIHFNPKLCLNLIAPLKNMTRDPESTFSQNEVSEDNNGDQALCFQDVLNLRLSELAKQTVVLTWNSYCLDDNRKLLGYSIYYTVAEHNVTLYERRDACSDTWSVFDKTVEDPRNASRKNDKNYLTKPCDDVQPLFQPLTQLIPYTRYAAYVKTYTTKQDKKGAQSPIIYFRTLPSNPSPPQDVTVESLTSHSVYIRWSPPLNPNGSITMYFVEIQANSYNRPKILSVNNNYCSDPSALANMVAARTEEISKKQEEKTTGEVKNGSCACKEEMKPSTRFNEAAEAERIESSDFENALQNQVYVKSDRSKTKSPANRIRRSIDNNLSKLVLLSEYNSPKFGFKYSNATDEEGYVRSLYYEFDGKARSLTVTNMRHCTWYTVNIWACRVKHENETSADYEKTWCSTRVRENFRTMPLSNADMVSNVQAEILPSNKTVPEVNVTWEPPKNPNGFVVAYNIHHSRVEENSQAQDVGLQSCIPADDYEANGHGYVLRNLAPGNYSIKVTPVTLAIAGNASAHIYVFIPERTIETGHEWIWGVVGGCLIMMMVLAGGIWYVRRGLLPTAEANKLFASVNPEYVSTVYVPDEWEVPRGNIEFIRELGQGSFGMVYEGIAKNIEKGVPETRCAVKTVNEHATDRERIEFLNEASVMKAFDTHHVVKLLGVVSRGQPTLVVMELMEFGDLKTYLRSHRPDSDNSLPGKEKNGSPPTLQNILQMAIEIADGMAYLSAKKFVHRDLAARNCMVTGELTVKVGDFGMTRDIYETDYYRKGTKGLLPVRWMSPESLKDGVFSSSSDVWSYGVVLWEMATLAMQPYQGLSNEQVLRYVVEGGVMERPEHCPDRLYELMRLCWAHRASQRPPFLRLVADLAAHAAPAFRHRSFFHSAQGQELYALQRAAMEEEQEMPEVNVGAVATGSGSNLFGVSGLASWVLSSLRSRTPEDAAEPLQPAQPATTPC